MAVKRTVSNQVDDFPSINLGTAIHRLRVSNFRTFKNLSLDLGPINVIVGPNASGKTNLIAIIRFLRDLAEDGLDNAISLQGGMDLVPNFNHPKETVKFEVSYSQEGALKGLELLFQPNIPLSFKNPRTTYILHFRADAESGFKIEKDDFNIHFECVAPGFKPRGSDYLERYGILRLTRRGERISANFHLPSALRIEPSKLTEPIAASMNLTPKDALFEQSVSIITFRPSAFFKDLEIFDFNPSLAKEAIFVAGKVDLDPDAENLPIVLSRLFEDDNRRNEFNRLMRTIIPEISNISVETYSDLSAIIKASEVYSKRDFPGSALSSGTINVAALITALYYDKSPVVIIEEPERYLHASLVPRVAQLLRARSKKKQVITTTHDSDLIAHFDVSAIDAVYRDKDGFSQVFKPANNVDIRQFLKRHIGLDRLNASRLLHEADVKG